MHPSIDQYLEVLHTRRRAPATLKVIRHDSPILSSGGKAHGDAHSIQRCFGMKTSVTGEASANVRRERLQLSLTADWPRYGDIVAGRSPVICSLPNPVTDVKDVPAEPLAPRSLPPQAIDALLRAA
jgi:hypothetical protein